ncbi:MAG TPA: hypothetical protein DCL00_00195 [Opitutae bacterium]|nr:hypothetical protein [Opitutae bacterium]
MRSAVRICHLPPLFFFFQIMARPKSKIEWIVIIGLTLLFAFIWLFAHWNLSRKPPYHKGPGSPGYIETSPTVETNQTSD